MGNSCAIVNREGMMHEELDLDAVSGGHGDFHLPRISGNTVKGIFYLYFICAMGWVKRG